MSAARTEAEGRAWEYSGVPRRYLGVEPYGEPVGWAYLEGGVGAGKTHMAAQMMRRFISDHMRHCGGPFWAAPRVAFVTAPGYLDLVRNGFDSDADRSKARNARRADLLVLDDLGQDVPTAWAVAQMFELINARYNDDLPTIVTSQFPLGGIARRMAEGGGREQALAIASRLVGECRYYRLTSRDRRRP